MSDALNAKERCSTEQIRYRRRHGSDVSSATIHSKYINRLLIRKSSTRGQDDFSRKMMMENGTWNTYPENMFTAVFITAFVIFIIIIFMYLTYKEFIYEGNQSG